MVNACRKRRSNPHYFGRNRFASKKISSFHVYFWLYYSQQIAMTVKTRAKCTETNLNPDWNCMTADDKPAHLLMLNCEKAHMIDELQIDCLRYDLSATVNRQW